MDQKQAIIIGAGPAGLTAAYELLKRTDIKPIVIEQSHLVGGISATYLHNGNRIDIGGHRFFTKSQRVLDWWLNFLPVEFLDDNEIKKSAYRQINPQADKNSRGPNPEKEDKVMLLRKRKSRIFFNSNYFDYPLQINLKTIKKLGIWRTVKIGSSYLLSIINPIKPEKSLEDFFINRFGRELYKTFFKSYTEKLWGISCSKIDPQWGAQRVKGLSITKAIQHFFQEKFTKKRNKEKTETSLIEYFLYPKHGPGQLWEEVANEIESLGGRILLNTKAIKLQVENNQVITVEAKETDTGKTTTFEGSHFFSTMPVKELIHSLNDEVPKGIQKIAKGLPYRDFITVGLLLKQTNLKTKKGNLINDNWIYIQEPDVKLGRIQLFNNWSPYMVSDPKLTWLGLEYFCSVGDELWSKSKDSIIQFAVHELTKLKMINRDDVIDSTVIKVPKAYPAYFGTYNHFDKIKKYIDKFENFYLIGRNGMHRYNNQDHSMLAAMVAVDNIIAIHNNHENIWLVNTEQTYHEKK